MRVLFFVLIGTIFCTSGAYYDHPFKETNELFKCSRYADAVIGYKALVRADWYDDVPYSVITEAYCNYAESLLGLEQYKKGFKWFDHRLDAHGRVPLINAWDGSDPAGKTILVRAEHGLGDTFMFARYMKVLHDLGARVVCAVQSPLKDFMIYAAPYVDVVYRLNEPFFEFDYDVYLMSLPRYLSSQGLAPTTIDTVPGGQAYLAPSQEAYNTWHNKIKYDHTFKIGICWRASKNLTGEYRYLERDVPLQKLVDAIHKVPGVTLYNLQGGVHRPVKTSEYALLSMNNELNGLDELDVIADESPGVVYFEHMDKEVPFQDTAALIACMDLVVGPATSVTCLAGALDKPTCFLSPQYGDWRWGTTRTVPVWYTSGRLFRQKVQGDHTQQLNELTDYISSLVS